MKIVNLVFDNSTHLLDEIWKLNTYNVYNVFECKILKSN